MVQGEKQGSCQELGQHCHTVILSTIVSHDSHASWQAILSICLYPASSVDMD